MWQIFKTKLLKNAKKFVWENHANRAMIYIPLTFEISKTESLYLIFATSYS